MSKIVSRFRNETPRFAFNIQRIVQFAHEEGDAYHERYMGSSSRTKVSTRTNRPTPVLATAILVVRPKKTSIPPFIPHYNRLVVSFKESTALYTINAYQPTISTAKKIHFRFR